MIKNYIQNNPGKAALIAGVIGSIVVVGISYKNLEYKLETLDNTKRTNELLMIHDSTRRADRDSLSPYFIRRKPIILANGDTLRLEAVLDTTIDN